MRESGFNREGWANTVEYLIRQHAQGNLERFAAMVDINPRTIRRWRECQVDVSLAAVLKVSAATHISVTALLKFAGLLGPYGDEEQIPDEETRMIRAASIDERTERTLLGYVADRQERDRRARIEDVEFFMNLARPAKPSR